MHKVNTMNKMKNQFILGTIILGLLPLFWITDTVSAAAFEGAGYDFPTAGIASELSQSSMVIEESDETEAPKLNIQEKFESERTRMLTEIFMANVNNTLNVRSDPSEESEKVGYMYRDCGGTILERGDGWTKISSGALTGWCSDEFLIFGDEAVAMAEDVGNWMVTTESEAMRLRKEPSEDAEVITLMSKLDIADFVEIIDDKWISVELDGELGYLNSEYVNITFHIDEGETMEHVKARLKIEEQLREEAEREAKEKAEKERAEKIKADLEKNKNTNRGSVTATADELRLLAALIYCEAGNQPYEGLVAVGAVVMNRVKSPAYPNTIYSVIYASGQFTPAMSGKVAKVYESGPPDRCYQAAAAALNGETTCGGATHFRRNNGRAGLVIGDHVFW